MQRYKDIVSGAFLLLIAAVLYTATFNIRTFMETAYGATFVPRLVAIVIAVLSLILLIQGIQKARRSEGEEGAETVPKSGRHVILTFGLIIGYILVLDKLGFILSTAIYSTLQMYVLSDFNRRKIVLYLIISTIASVTLYLVFKKLLYVMLPTGILG
jgi:Tripartite tricarboxylate transporter TctB family.